MREEDPRVVHEHIDAAEGGGCLVHHRFHSHGIAKVCLDDEVTVAGEGCEGRAGSVGGRPVMDGDAVAERRKFASHGGPDAA